VIRLQILINQMVAVLAEQAVVVKQERETEEKKRSDFCDELKATIGVSVILCFLCGSLIAPSYYIAHFGIRTWCGSLNILLNIISPLSIAISCCLILFFGLSCFLGIMECREKYRIYDNDLLQRAQEKEKNVFSELKNIYDGIFRISQEIERYEANYMLIMLKFFRFLLAYKEKITEGHFDRLNIILGKFIIPLSKCMYLFNWHIFTKIVRTAVIPNDDMLHLDALIEELGNTDNDIPNIIDACVSRIDLFPTQKFSKEIVNEVLKKYVLYSVIWRLFSNIFNARMIDDFGNFNARITTDNFRHFIERIPVLIQLCDIKKCTTDVVLHVKPEEQEDLNPEEQEEPVDLNPVFLEFERRLPCA